jgi:hypothetical protein
VGISGKSDGRGVKGECGGVCCASSVRFPSFSRSNPDVLIRECCKALIVLEEFCFLYW